MSNIVKPAGALLVLMLLVWLSVLTVQIVRAGSPTRDKAADVAIILGAAAYGENPSPVFEERIKHGISLYRAKAVKKLIFTGGRGRGTKTAEAIVAERYAMRNGVPSQDILTETLSQTTRQNLIHARRLMSANSLEEALIVSDPLHLKRALRMASDLEIDAYASPTPSTRYRSWRTKAGFVLRELYFYNHYLITGR
jgi:uncharacterized SAM-binding protein YcdF (DUF218 family)